MIFSETSRPCAFLHFHHLDFLILRLSHYHLIEKGILTFSKNLKKENLTTVLSKSSQGFMLAKSKTLITYQSCRYSGSNHLARPL